MTDTFQGTITLAGKTYPVRIEHRGNRVIRFIGDETVEAFIERASLLGRADALGDLAAIGRGVKNGSKASPQGTAWSRHRARERAN